MLSGRTVPSVGMAYDWRPTATRAATTDPAVVVLPRRQSKVAAAAHVRRADDILVAAAIEEFIAAAEGGWARNRSGRRYRPSADRMNTTTTILNTKDRIRSGKSAIGW